MKSRAKRTQGVRHSMQATKTSGVFVVPSHGRLARRGSTEIIEDDADHRGASKDASGVSR